MRTFLFAFAMLLSLSAFCQKEIQLTDVKYHSGDSVIVRGKITGVRFLESAKNTPTFINIGGVYPNQLLTIVIWGNVRAKLGYDPSDNGIVGGIAVATGKIELYRDKPQIVITDPSQLRILIDEEVPASEVPPIQKKN